MEWYYIVAIIVAFIALLVGLYFLGKKGILGKDQMRMISSTLSCISDVLGNLTQNAGNATLNVVNMLMKLVSTATLAAENAWYNGEIDKNERYEYCIDALRGLLEAYEVQLTEAQWGMVDTLISAACEEMGHTVKLDDVDVSELPIA